MTQNKRPTETEIYTTIKNAMGDNADIVAFCDKKLAAIEKKASANKEKAAEKQAFLDDLYDVLKTHKDGATSKEIAESMVGVTARKVSANMRFLVSDGRAEKVASTSKNAAARYIAL